MMLKLLEFKDAIKRMNNKRDSLLALEGSADGGSLSVSDDGNGNVVIS